MIVTVAVEAFRTALQETMIRDLKLTPVTEPVKNSDTHTQIRLMLDRNASPMVYFNINNEGRIYSGSLKHDQLNVTWTKLDFGPSLTLMDMETIIRTAANISKFLDQPTAKLANIRTYHFDKGATYWDNDKDKCFDVMARFGRDPDDFGLTEQYKDLLLDFYNLEQDYIMRLRDQQAEIARLNSKIPNDEC
jgi:hypothetical protein